MFSRRIAISKIRLTQHERSFGVVVSQTGHWLPCGASPAAPLAVTWVQSCTLPTIATSGYDNLMAERWQSVRSE